MADRRARWLVVVLAVAVACSAGTNLWAQDGDGLGLLMANFFTSLAAWMIGASILYWILLVFSARLAGVSAGCLHGCGAMLLGGAMILVLTFVGGRLIGNALGPAMVTVLSNVIGLACMTVATKLLFGTDYERALLSVLMAYTALIVLATLALILIY